MIQVHQPAFFAGGSISLGLAFYFVWPYIMGALAALDRRGRWTATGSGVAGVGAAIGPFIGGVLLTWGWGAISLLILVSTFGGLALFGAAGLIIGPVIAGVTITMWEIFEETFGSLDTPENEEAPATPETRE